jgi:uncharacterized membrane protein
MSKERKADLSTLLRPYENKWIALTLDNSKVVAAAKTLSDLLRKLKGKDAREFEFMKVPDFKACYAPAAKI